MKFAKIATADLCGLTGSSAEKIYALSTAPAAIHNDDPKDEAEIIRRIGDADCVLVSWRTRIGPNVFAACPNIRYVGMCCTLYSEEAANVDIAAARGIGAVVTGVSDYGDDGTNEFIFASLINLYKGLGGQKWSDVPSELTSKTLGIVGLGFLGKMVAHTAQAFGMKVLYYSRTRKPEMEETGVEYRDFPRLLAESDVVSAHLPRNLVLFHSREFDMMKKNAVFVNTSLGQPFDADALFSWAGRRSGNFVIFDLPGSGTVAEECKKYPNIILYDRPSGFTHEARIRLTDKVLANMEGFLSTLRA